MDRAITEEYHKKWIGKETHCRNSQIWIKRQFHSDGQGHQDFETKTNLNSYLSHANPCVGNTPFKSTWYDWTICELWYSNPSRNAWQLWNTFKITLLKDCNKNGLKQSFLQQILGQVIGSAFISALPSLRSPPNKQWTYAVVQPTFESDPQLPNLVCVRVLACQDTHVFQATPKTTPKETKATPRLQVVLQKKRHRSTDQLESSWLILSRGWVKHTKSIHSHSIHHLIPQGDRMQLWRQVLLHLWRGDAQGVVTISPCSGCFASWPCDDSDYSGNGNICEALLPFCPQHETFFDSPFGAIRAEGGQRRKEEQNPLP